jgi:hypothetical protein
LDAKRLLRLVASPAASSALAYALLGFVGGLVWLSLATRGPMFALPWPGMPSFGVRSVGAPSLGEPPGPLAAPSSGRVTLQEAIGSVRRFADEPALVLEGGLQSEGAEVERAGLYYLERVSPTRGEDFFKVDARTAEVVEATFRSRMVPAGDAVDLSMTDAEAEASEFATAHFSGFEQLVLVDRSARTSETGPTYSFKWSQVSPESGAELPTSVSVAVMGRSGQVFWYLSQRDPLQIDSRPAVDQERAEGIARAWLLPRDDRWNLDRPTAVRLQVLYDDDDRQQLIWSVQYAAQQEGPRATIRLLVDAQTGTIIQGAG